MPIPAETTKGWSKAPRSQVLFSNPLGTCRRWIKDGFTRYQIIWGFTTKPRPVSVQIGPIFPDDRYARPADGVVCEPQVGYRDQPPVDIQERNAVTHPR